jgi:hypothetical protein
VKREEERRLSPGSSELVDRGDLDELTVHVNGLVAQQLWGELDALRLSCRQSFERGKQLWAVAAHIEYRVCLEGPGEWAALMLESGSGRFGLGPLPEVAASAHSWDELSPHLQATPQAAMAAHERVLRGDDLSGDIVASRLPEVLDLPLQLEPWEPAYALAEYHEDKMEAPMPRLPPLRPSRPNTAHRGPAKAQRGVVALGLAGRGPGKADEVSSALEELANTWTSESNGRAAAVCVEGRVPDAVAGLGAPLMELVELTPADAMAVMAWTGASGGAHGRRRGAAPGRFAAWWVLAAAGGLADHWPPRPGELGRALEYLRWYAWGAGEPATGWVLRLALEATGGPNRGRAWAVAATDAH